MTKQEERNLLKKIEKLIAEAGEDSYIGTAFAGCVQMAETNIENDWACSYQNTIEHANKQIEALKEANAKNAPAIEHLEKKLAEKDEEINQLRQQLRAEKKKQIPADLYINLWQTIEGQERQAKEEIEKTAEYLSLYADEPSDIAVANGLQRLQQAHQKRNDATKLLEELEKYEPKNI